MVGCMYILFKIQLLKLVNHDPILQARWWPYFIMPIDLLSWQPFINRLDPRPATVWQWHSFAPSSLQNEISFVHE